MPAKKEPSAKYRVLRDWGGNLAGDIIELEVADAADLIRDGVLSPAEEG